MKKRKGFGSELTLLELLIVIGIFAVFATACLRIFAYASKISHESDRLGHAIIAAENAAECFKAGLDPILYYTADWVPSEEKDAEFILGLETSAQNYVRTAKITVTDKKDSDLFTMTVKTLTEAER